MLTTHANCVELDFFFLGSVSENDATLVCAKTRIFHALAEP